MMKFTMTASFLMALSACAGTNAESGLDRRVTRIDDVKPGTARRAADAPAEPQEPSPPRVEVTLPGPDWLMQRDVTVSPNVPPAPVLLVNIKPKATLFIVLFPSEIGAPKAVAEMQRDVFVKAGMKCSKVTVSKDGKQAGFTTEMQTDRGLRKGKTVFLLLDNRKDVLVVMFGSWDAAFDKDMLPDADKAIGSVTLK